MIFVPGKRAQLENLDREMQMDTFFKDLRMHEFSRLDDTGQTYLDYTGAAIPPMSVIREHLRVLEEGVFGNPHSRNPTSAAATERVESARKAVLRFFQASGDEYEVIFTPNASGAIKLVGEAFGFVPGSRLVLLADNHNSVLGLREYASRTGAEVRIVPLSGEMRADDPEPALRGANPARANLFAFPGQSNFSGVKHPLEWLERARALGYATLLDGAALVPTTRLDLSAVKPDFLCISFYKMFGYPTGIGALLARRDALNTLRRPWFGGGTVLYASARRSVHLLHALGRAFEDGTVNFLGIPAVEMGLRFMEGIGMERVEARVRSLTAKLLRMLTHLRHLDGAPLVRIHGPVHTAMRGGTVSFTVLDRTGAPVEFQRVEQHSASRGVSLRTGFFCNPGAAEHALGYTNSELERCHASVHDGTYSLKVLAACVGAKPTGAVRVSVGIPTNLADLSALGEVLGEVAATIPDRRLAA